MNGIKLAFAAAPHNKNGYPELTLRSKRQAAFSEARLTLSCTRNVDVRLGLDRRYAATYPNAPYAEYSKFKDCLDREGFCDVRPIMLVGVDSDNHTIGLQCSPDQLPRILAIAGIPLAIGISTRTNTRPSRIGPC